MTNTEKTTLNTNKLTLTNNLRRVKKMRFFKIIDRPYESEAEFCYSTEDGFFITDKGTCISSKESDHYSFEEISLEEYEAATTEPNQ